MAKTNVTHHRVTVTYDFDPDDLTHLSGGGDHREGRTPADTAEILMDLYIPGCLTENLVSVKAAAFRK